MVLELHTWGPAFSLPSIDPQCLAAIAYLTQTVPRGQWVLVASNDTTLSPTRELPTLRNRSTTISGFENIVEYLSKQGDGEWDIDNRNENSNHKADITAFTSLLHSHGLPLLDLHLYVSAPNYTSTTRPTLSRLLNFPTQYTIPPQRRALAKKRTQHLGLSSLDLENIDQQQAQELGSHNASWIPASLRTVRQSVTGLVKEEKSGDRFRLDAQVDTLCEPLNELLAGKRWMLSDDAPSSLDCLAVGYLSLALTPEVPQPWFKEGLKTRYPALRTYIQRGIEEFFGSPVESLPDSLSSEPKPNDSTNTLPWTSPSPHHFSTTAPAFLKTLLPTHPFSSPILKSPSSTSSTPSTWPLPAIVVTTAAAVVAVGAYVFYPAVMGLRQESEMRKLEDLGEAGALLAGVGFGGGGEMGGGGLVGGDSGDLRL